MRKLIVISILLLSLCFTNYSQDSTSSYIGFNLPPIIGSTIELGYEINPKPFLTFDFYGGYTINNKLNLFCTKELREYEYSYYKNSGFFLKIGGKLNWRNNLNKFAPFLGLNVINSIGIQKGILEVNFEYDGQELPSNRSEKNSYNLGVSGIIGVTSPSTKKLSYDLGIQVTGLIVNNLLTNRCTNYMPGMGFGGQGIRAQGVLRVKYKIK